MDASAAAGGVSTAAYAPRRPDETLLYRVVAERLERFLARQRRRERPLPRFVEREFRKFLACGILAHGFLRVRCPECRLERLVPFSCKGRSFCPSCTGRRMAETAAHLVDRVLPFVPVRQWVLSLPWTLRLRLAFDPGLTRAVVGVFVRAIFGSLRRRARGTGVPGRLDCGAVTFIQRAGVAVNLNLHVHTLVPDGVWAVVGGEHRFVEVRPLEDGESGGHRSWYDMMARR